jgi:hypothetical protein
VAEIGGPFICKAGEVMSLIESQGQLPVVAKKASVRVKLERIDCNVSRSLPPEGDQHIWMERLKAALGQPRWLSWGAWAAAMVATVTLWQRQRRQAGYRAVLRFWSRRCAGCGAADRRSFA